MKIKIKNLKFHNFLSFEDGNIDFTTSGYTLVQGVNNNASDMAISNGSGKSSIFEALSWCLTGELIRGSKTVKRIGADEKDSCFAVVEFNIDNNEYIINRSSSPSKLQFIVNGKDVSGKGIRDTEKIIHEYLPNLTSSLLGSVIILGQGLPQRFSNNTPAGRKEVLETLSNSDIMLYDLKDRISNRSAELEKRERKLDDDLLRLNTQKEMVEKEIPLIKNELDNLPSKEELENKLNELNSKLSSNKLELENNNNLISELQQNKDTANNELIQLERNYNESIKNETSQFSNSLNDLKTKEVECQALIKSKTKEINKLKNIKDVCPTCGQKLPGVEKVNTIYLEEEVCELNTKLNDIKQNKKEIDDNITTITKKIQDAFESKIYLVNTNINNISNKINDVNAQIKNLNVDINNIVSKISSIETQKANIEEYKVNLETKLDSYIHSIDDFEKEKLYINNDKDELQLHIDIIQKMKTVINRDFRGYLLLSVINFINNKAKEYSQDVFGTDKINFSLEGNNIEISYDNKEYSNLSGGERQKVDLIIQFALRDMLCKYHDFSSNIIVIDELFDNLDSVGCEKILNFISSKLIDVENIYIITHHADIPIPFDNILTVTKGEDGISRVN